MEHERMAPAPDVRPPTPMGMAAVVVLLLAAPMGSDGFVSTSSIPPRTSVSKSVRLDVFSRTFTSGNSDGHSEMSPYGPWDRDAALEYYPQPYKERDYHNGFNDYEKPVGMGKMAGTGMERGGGRTIPPKNGRGGSGGSTSSTKTNRPAEGSRYTKFPAGRVYNNNNGNVNSKVPSSQGRTLVPNVGGTNREPGYYFNPQTGGGRIYNNGFNDNSNLGHHPGGGGSAVALGRSNSGPPPPEQTPYGYSQWGNRGVMPLAGERPRSGPFIGQTYNDGGTYEMEEWQPKQWWRGSTVENGRPMMQQGAPPPQSLTSPPAASLPRSTSPRTSPASTPRTSSPPSSTTTREMSSATSATSSANSTRSASRASPPAPFFLTKVMPEGIAEGTDTDELTELCDITLVSNDKVDHPAHRMMLAVRSSVLRDAFRDKARGKGKDGELQVDASSGAVSQLLNYIYTDNIDDLSTKNDDDSNGKVLEEMFNLGVKYELPQLMLLADEQMVNTITIENAATRLLMAMRHDSPYKGYYVRTVKDNLVEVMQTDMWEEVAKDPATMAALLSEDGVSNRGVAEWRRTLV